MALGDIKQGYMGLAFIGSNELRCTDFSIQVQQQPLFYDHTIGLRDSIPVTLIGGKGDIGALNIQKTIWRPSVKSYQGSITFPITSLGGDPLYEYAKTGDDFDLEFQYTCGISRNYNQCKVNSYTFTATAGDFCTVSADIMCLQGLDGTLDSKYTEVEKIVTWDDVDISIGGLGVSDCIQAFTFTVNNNCKAIYTAGGNIDLSLNPILIRVGMQEIQGAISFYNQGNILEFLEDITSPKTISVSAYGIGIDLYVLFKPQERSGSTGPVISTLPFVGVDYALGT